MRVGIDYRPALTHREGIGRYTRELVRGLVELNYGQHLGLFGYTWSPVRVPREELGLDGSGAELVRLRFPSRWLPTVMQRLGRGADDLVGGAAVFHHPQYNVLPVREAAEVATIHDCIYMQDAGYMDPAIAQKLTGVAREMVARAKRVLVPSQFSGAEVVMALGAHPARVSHTPLGCDHITRDLPPEGFPKADEPYVLTVSRVEPRKNHVRTLQAFELLVREGFPHRWVVAGPAGWGSEDFERALANSPARHRVEWRRFVSETELPRLYSQADAFLFPSLSEGFGLPPLEAMACGTPTVASCVTSMPEVCGEAAFLVEPTEPERIFEATRRILAEPEIALDFSMRGRARAREFTWRECARSTLLAYQAAARGGDEEPQLRKSL